MLKENELNMIISLAMTLPSFGLQFPGVRICPDLFHF